MTSVFFDTNVWLPALLADGFCRRLIRETQQRATVVISAELMDEVAEKLALKFRVSWETISEAKASMNASGRMFAQTVEPFASSPDPDDALLLAQALAAGCERFVTFDGPLQELETVDAMRIIAPQAFAGEFELS